jgi:hypothetical protein
MYWGLSFRTVSFFRAYVAPLLIVLTFLIAMLAVSARIFLPNDMMAPAPIEEPMGRVDLPTAPSLDDIDSDTVSEVSWLLKGLPG